MGKILKNYPLLKHNTFHIDINCDIFFDYDTEAELVEYIKSGQLIGVKFLHIGSGSNLLFTGDFEGTILHSSIDYIKIKEESSDDIIIEVGSGVNWDDLCAYCVKNNYYGMENLSFIPGVAGASAIQNIGAYGVEAADLITTVNAVDVETGSTRVFRNEECCYGYRESVFKKELKNKYFITSVCYRLSKISGFNLRYGNLKNSLPENPTLAQVRETIIRIREEKLPNPAVIGNAGSFFMNPVISKVMYEDILTRYDDIPCYRVDENNVKVPAAYLIEKCGWKGAKIGRAHV